MLVIVLELVLIINILIIRLKSDVIENVSNLLFIINWYSEIIIMDIYNKNTLLFMEFSLIDNRYDHKLIVNGIN